MDTINAIHTRRSTRDYQKRTVERAMISDILWDAVQAPTTPVSGPFLFHVIEGLARIADMGERAKQYARRQRPGAVGYAWADNPDFKVFLDAPVVIVISGHSKNSEAIQDCNRAGQNVVLSAHARGLGSCWVGAPMLWLRCPETRRELGIAEAFEPFAAFTLGYAASIPPSHSRDRPEIVWVR
jgi:nitroreductase